MTAETSNARGEWVLVPREPTQAMISHGEEWEYSTISNGPAMARQLYAAMLAAAPPPPPAGDADVWLFKGTDGAWHTFHSEQHRLDTIADGRWEVRKFTALSQQPAPPSAPVGVEDVVMAARNAENAIRNCAAAGQIGEGYVQYADDLRDAVQRLAQQPAAVDGAMPVLIELVATLAATGTVTGGRIYFPERQTRELLKKACDALATQHQEPTT